MAYTAPIFKDRIAIGDNKYTMSDVGNGKILLTPAPDEVSEVGTDINKAVMQPLCDTVAQLDKNIVPYLQYYWLSRGISGYYSEVQSSAWAYSDCYTHIAGFSKSYSFIYLFSYSDNAENTSCTVNYSSKININQSSGTISLVSPQTTTFTVSQSYSTITSTLSGKYVTGLRPKTNQVFYISPSSVVELTTTLVNGATFDAIGYKREYRNGEDYGGDDIFRITSKYNSTNTDWGVISSTEPNTYPTSGTIDGTEYIKLGRIDEAFLNYAVNNPSAFKDLIASYEARISALEAAIAGI